MKKEILSYLEIQEVIEAIFNLEEDEKEMDELDEMLNDKWYIDSTIFGEILQSIYDLIGFSVSELTQTAYVGLAKNDKWLIRKNADQEFIHSVIKWCTEGEEITPDIKGFAKTITNKGIPEYEIIIKKL